jgi:type II secretory pathway component GspD/PulD (secretin)
LYKNIETIKEKISVIVIASLLLVVSACQTTSNQSRGVESDKDLVLPHSYQDDVSRKTTRKTNAYSSDVLKKRDIRRSGERMISKKQVEAIPVTISDKMRKQLVRDAKRATKEGRYEDALKISDAILRERPYDRTALVLKENAKALQEDMRHETILAKIERVDARERNKYFENLKEKSIPYNDLMQFPKEDEWTEIKERARKEDPEKRLEENRKHTERLKQSPSPVQKSISQEMQMKLDERLSIEFINTPLRDVIAFLQEKSKMNFFLDKDAPDTSVNIKLKDVPLSVILEYILPKNLSYVVQDNIVHVTLKPLELRVYDVRDLLINLEDRLGDLTTQSVQAAETEEQRTAASGDTFDRVKEIINLITSTIKPASWSANGGNGMIAAREGMLGDIVVTHTVGVHNRVEGLLAALRSSADLQIAIEARFIAVSDNFLEAYGHNINSADFRGQDDSERGGIFASGTDKFIDTGSTTGLGLAAGTTTGLNLSYQIFGGSFIEGFLKAVQESDEAETVTAPKITLSNTQRGSIKVVTTESYISSYTIVSQTPQPVMSEIDEGTTFNVRPVVSADRKYVYLEVHPIITDVELVETDFQTVGQSIDATTPSTATNKIQRPQTVKQELSVTVCVPDKGILMIGGLGKSSLTKTSKGVPVLSKIPIIKRLFSSDVVDRDITTAGNLIILIKPTILIREEEEARAFTKKKRGAEIRSPAYGP